MPKRDPTSHIGMRNIKMGFLDHLVFEMGILNYVMPYVSNPMFGTQNIFLYSQCPIPQLYPQIPPSYPFEDFRRENRGGCCYLDLDIFGAVGMVSLLFFFLTEDFLTSKVSTRLPSFTPLAWMRRTTKTT